MLSDLGGTLLIGDFYAITFSQSFASFADAAGILC
jgi:hypothetical protein